MKTLILLILLTTSFVLAEPAWQQSESAAVTLGVRDKYGELGFYTVTFNVTKPDGSVSTRQISINADDWGEVIFPNDFNTYAAKGKYTWEALVNGTIVALGSFEFKDNRTLTINKTW